MAKKNGNSEKKGAPRFNTELVFEKLPADFELPKKNKSSEYGPTVEKLASADSWVVVFVGGEGEDGARAANVRRRSLLNAAESKRIDIEASVRCIDGSHKLIARKAQPEADTAE